MPETLPPAAQPQHVDVVVIGAGLSGVGAAAQLRARHPERSVAVLEARESMGGTWDLFRYPGIRSDSDMFTFGYKWRPWKSDVALADGPLIRDYIHTVAEEYGVHELVRYRHRVLRAAWDSAEARWTLTVAVGDPAQGETVTMTADFLWSCAGYYRYDQGFQPQWPGMADFRGDIVHPQHWPDDLDYRGKRVVVVGSGATAVTLVPAMAPDAEHVTMLQRTPTYVLSRPGRDPVARLLGRVPDKLSYPVVRWWNILQAIASFQVSRRWPGFAKNVVRKGVAKSLPEGFDVDTHFSPPYNPWEQRLCFVPDGDLFRAIRRGQASIATGVIETFTPTGVRLASGEEIDADVVVTATGFQLLLPFGGVEIEVDGAPLALEDQMAYKALMISGMPNFAFTIGYTNASWTLKADLVIDYVCRLLDHMDRHGYRIAVPELDPTVERRPLMDLSSGYIQRSAHLLPAQGDRPPWRLDQNYITDRRVIQRSPIDDGVIRFK
ncbi:NAD(P)/FAD-dependent oxidoreductase [Nocardioides sp. TF02-7]|uniref:flavin-containing monooxygenase n=1 Tax=Nocardioides sp. TF02-7 TaxID=2917724 RepID=UPI001F061FBB|nr:NAD(P)/FAD-dependent oxidoreductase [Nocardioides sp. TF02-7]UMG94067.1 NAD(P)/FAD-dependent oxidoreductase [Nocardioides sp. TF02-7]